ncbi:hypothetical protein U27_02603 [Candidatus Vecturithrix granuli]|uniref:Uncharacterized protein n=1 Tax=Vecturithrix granuli TaxID=1499967 RepID=A0A081CB17_VECG1|nr:hypothetical protein U27_02603 [Candidatus Vecturithrix granuli]
MANKTTPYVRVCPGCGLTVFVRVPSQHFTKILAAIGKVRDYWPEATEEDLRVIDTGLCGDCYEEASQAMEDLIQGDLSD